MTNTDFYHRMYDILQIFAGARPSHREDFVNSMSADPKDRVRSCNEYRFQGDLGFGGKLFKDFHDKRVGSHNVRCYIEDLESNYDKIQLVNEKIRDLEVTYNKEKIDDCRASEA